MTIAGRSELVAPWSFAVQQHLDNDRALPSSSHQLTIRRDVLLSDLALRHNDGWCAGAPGQRTRAI